MLRRGRERLLTALLLALPLGAALAQSGAQVERQSILGRTPLPRLSTPAFDIPAPSTRVDGEPGSLRIVDRDCSVDTDGNLRQRIVDIAVQEWAWFGFPVEVQRVEDAERDFSFGGTPPWRLQLYSDEVARVAATVAGYWAAAPDSGWLLQRQNEVWQREEGLGRRWRDPWSAAFISWVMCESGLGEQARFQRAVAHHSYIDQAILARENRDTGAAYHAYNPGEAEILPGDLLCSGLRPRYRNLDERRANLGEGARTHCDIVVDTDAENGRILTIGGNVRASVRMKVFPAARESAQTRLAPLPTRRIIFAHLKLQRDTDTASGIALSPTLRRLACALPAEPDSFAEAGLRAPPATC